MNVARVKKDLEVILGDYRRRRVTQGLPVWSRHTWRILPDGSFEVVLFDYPLPANAWPRSTHVKVEGRKCLYDPAGKGKYHFYRNVWLGHNVQVRVPKGGGWGRLPRLGDPDGQGWLYLCIHPGTVDGDANITHFLRTLELHVNTADPRVW